MVVTNSNGGRNAQSSNNLVRRFFICSEGKTEESYFRHLNYIIQNNLEVEDLILQPEVSSFGPDPTKVLKTMKSKYQSIKFRSIDEEWLVVDRDAWTDDQYSELEDWESPDKNRHWVISNPCFEFWLLLHFEDGRGIKTKDECFKKLRKYVPKYDKTINRNIFDLTAIRNAVTNVQSRNFGDNSYCRATPGTTTVDKLVARVLNLEETT